MAGSDFVAVAVSGLDDLDKAFAEIGAVGSKQALTDALKKAAQPVAEEARRLAPVGPVDPSDKSKPLAQTIVVRTSLSKSQMRKRGGRREAAEVFVGSSAPHAHLVEFGHILVKARHEGVLAMRGRRGKKTLQRVKTKRVIGHVSARPFLRPAFDTKRREFGVVFFREINGAVLKVAKRYGRQAERGKLSRGAKVAFRAELAL
jgi:HK97 gp10 family phage protein